MVLQTSSTYHRNIWKASYHQTFENVYKLTITETLDYRLSDPCHEKQSLVFILNWIDLFVFVWKQCKCIMLVMRSIIFFHCRVCDCAWIDRLFDSCRAVILRGNLSNNKILVPVQIVDCHSHVSGSVPCCQAVAAVVWTFWAHSWWAWSGQICCGWHCLLRQGSVLHSPMCLFSPYRRCFVYLLLYKAK